MMKKNFNSPGQCLVRRQYRLGLIIAVLASPIYAEGTLNKLEKNDKIHNNSQILQVAGNNTLDNASATVTSTADNMPRIRALRAEQWELNRTGETILSIPVLNEVVNSWLLDKNRKIEVRYPGGEEGEFWVQELTDWLVSLGIPSNRIVTIPGSGADDMIKFALLK